MAILILKNTYKKVILSIVLISILLVLMYWFIPMKTSYRTNIKQSDISVINVYRRGYFDDKYNTPVVKITDKEKIQEIINYLSSIRTSKRLNNIQNTPEDAYEYVITYYTVNKVNFMIYINNKVMQITENNKVSVFNITPETNVLEYLDNLFNNTL